MNAACSANAAQEAGQPARPEPEYLAFTSRFFLKSALRVPAFMRQSLKIMKQADSAPGIVGWSLGANLPKLEFYRATPVAPHPQGLMVVISRKHELAPSKSGARQGPVRASLIEPQRG